MDYAFDDATKFFKIHRVEGADGRFVFIVVLSEGGGSDYAAELGVVGSTAEAALRVIRTCDRDSLINSLTPTVG